MRYVYDFIQLRPGREPFVTKHFHGLLYTYKRQDFGSGDQKKKENVFLKRRRMPFKKGIKKTPKPNRW